MSSLAPRFIPSVLCCAAALVACAPALAQNTTAAVGGRVLTPAGTPVALASVQIRHDESGSVVQTLTDADGRFSARGLRAGGPYTVVVTKGSDTETRRDLYLQLADMLALDIRLGARNELDRVTITGTSSPAFNNTNMGAGTSLSARDLAAHASIARNLQDYARQDPRLAQTDKERGEISAMGQNSRYNSITVDGVTINDTFGLESNNLPTAKQPISIDAVDAVQVNLSNYDVTQKGYTGANINAVTKSGTNELKGSVYYVWRNASLAGQRYNRAAGTYFDATPYTERTLGATLGLPLIANKLFLFASLEDLKSNRAQPEFGPIGSPLTNVAISPSAIASLAQVASSKYGFDVGQPRADSALSVKDALIKLDWNINEQHRANVRYTRTQQSETNGGSFGGFSPTSVQLTSAWYQQEKTIETVVAQWFADWSDAFSTELKLSNRDYHSEPRNNSRLPAMALLFSGPAPTGAPAGVNTGSRFLNFGTERSRHFNVLDTQTQDAYLGATYVRGDHEIKFGGDWQRNQVYNAFFQDTFGNYTFSCQNSSAGLTYSFGAINCATATAAQIEAAVLENFSRGRPSSYTVQVGNTAGGYTLQDGVAQWTLNSMGLFLQDTWQVSRQLTLNAGVRMDRLDSSDRPLPNVAANAPLVAGSVSGNVLTRNTGGFGLDNTQTIAGLTLWQPRLGFNLNIPRADQRKLQVRGGLGLFQGAAANVWLSNPYSNTGVTTRVIGCGTSGFGACPAAGNLFSPNPDQQPTQFVGNPPAANVDFIAKGLGQPSVWKMNLAVDAELPWFGLVAGAEWLGTKTQSGIYYQHLNLGGATSTAGPDGRPMFWMPQSYNPSCWSSSGALLTTAGTSCVGGRARALSNASFNNVLLAAETSQGGGNAITLSLSRPAREGFGWQVAYTRTSATEVSPLTSSVSNSNFNSRSIFSPNEDVAANSAYLVRDRLSASANWSRAFISHYKTTIGVFYEGRKGKPYSWTYGNDMNGDGVAGNDLMYIPKAPQSGEVVFVGDTAANRTNEDRFWSIVNRYPELAAAKGQVVSRNGSFAPFVNSFDVRISQELPGFSAKHKGTISLDILNFGNLLNKNWGRINEMGFNSGGASRRSFVNYAGTDANGRYVYSVSNAETDYTLRQVKGESQWAAQVTVRYSF